MELYPFIDRKNIELAWFAAPDLPVTLRGDPGRLRVLAAAVLRSVTDEDYGPVEIATPQEVLDAMAARGGALSRWL